MEWMSECKNLQAICWCECTVEMFGHIVHEQAALNQFGSVPDASDLCVDVRAKMGRIPRHLGAFMLL